MVNIMPILETVTETKLTSQYFESHGQTCRHLRMKANTIFLYYNYILQFSNIEIDEEVVTT